MDKNIAKKKHKKKSMIFVAFKLSKTKIANEDPRAKKTTDSNIKRSYCAPIMWVSFLVSDILKHL